MTPTELIQKYEIPKEYHEAILEAYKQGFVDGGITGIKQMAKQVKENEV